VAIVRRSIRRPLAVVPLLFAACASGPDRHTLAELRDVEPDLRETEIGDGLDEAMAGYRAFLEEAPESALTPEAMRRLADLKLEKEFGLLGGAEADSMPGGDRAATAVERATPAPESARVAATTPRITSGQTAATGESRDAFEQRAAGGARLAWQSDGAAMALPEGAANDTQGPLEAIALYDRILNSYPDYPHNDQVLYQKARALDELGRPDEAIAVTERLIAEYPHSRHIDEVQFRRAEYFFMRKRFIEAEEAYGAIVAHGARSDYYALALYKLGWTLYKQMLLEEALEQYITLLDYEVATGTDFDAIDDDTAQARIDDTFRVVSLCFSDLGGAEVLEAFFTQIGPRSYEDRVYRQLGEFYFEKLRYQDAALVYRTFIERYPTHAIAPHFSMRIVEIYDEGNFPKLVLESKKEFAVRYGLSSDYWTHHDVATATEVMAFLKQNLHDLANHYHALYQHPERPEDRNAHFEESSRWYREYLESFADDPDTPPIHYRFADLLLEHERFHEAAVQYEKVAYGYPVHDQSAAAGYAAVFAFREHAERVDESESEAALREVVASSIRFADAFPAHEQAPMILAAAAEDLYGLEDHAAAIETGRRLIAQYPDAPSDILQATWTVVAHASFDSADYVAAEEAYTRVLERTPDDDESAAKLTNNLAASIYKQGEQASEAGDDRTAADHFLRIAEVAPDSDIRPVAEYDAAASLIRLEDWTRAAEVLETFRKTHPQHELRRDATRQIAFVYREAGETGRAAVEYERVADEADDPEMQREALLLAGELHEEAGDLASALRVYERYVTVFTTPIERAVVTRFEMAELHKKMGNDAERRSELRRIVAIDAAAGEDRTPTVRTLGARSALLLSEVHYDRFAAIELRQPFAASLQKKQTSMRSALAAFEKLIDYGVAEVTAAATYYMAEVYNEFSRALKDSERPADLSGSDLLDYNDMLEEEAYTFEEKAIEVHEKNLELVANGIFNEWIEKSLARLAVSVPGRYAKHEIGTGPLESIDTYAYHVPTPIAPETEIAAPATDADEPAIADEDALPDETVVAGEDALPDETVVADEDALPDETVVADEDALPDETVVADDATDANESEAETLAPAAAAPSPDPASEPERAATGTGTRATQAAAPPSEEGGAETGIIEPDAVAPAPAAPAMDATATPTGTDERPDEGSDDDA
jgi:tetratricopeptide (TPR) repeat protein